MELIIVTPLNLRDGSTSGPSLWHQIDSENEIKTVDIQEKWGNRNQARNKGFAAATGKWVYFIDQDIRFPDLSQNDWVARWQFLTRLPDDLWLVAGPYSDPPRLGYWGRSYNWLSNLWLEAGERGGRALAGNLILRHEIPLKTPFKNDLIEGGEEIELCHSIQALGGRCIYSKALVMEHFADTTLKHCWTRFRSHLKVKKQLDPALAKTPLSFELLKAVLTRPSFWPVVFIYLLALGLPQFKLNSAGDHK